MNHPERRLLISVDMERYSRRSNRQQFEAQQAFQQLLHAAASAVGLDRFTWITQQSGDGELTVLPADTQEPTVIGRFVPELNRLLREYNTSRVSAARVRLRVALHQGLVHLDGRNGFPGTAVTYVSRLCDAQPLKEALAAFPEAGVALAVSSDIYRDVVTEYPEQLRPERFRQIEVHHRDKDFREFAWICVIDEDFSTLAGPPGSAGPAPQADPAGPLSPWAGPDADGSRAGGPDWDGSRAGGPDADGSPGGEPGEVGDGRAGRRVGSDAAVGAREARDQASDRERPAQGERDRRHRSQPRRATALTGGQGEKSDGHGGIRTGEIRVDGQNAIGHGATAIGSVGRDVRFGRDGRNG